MDKDGWKGCGGDMEDVWPNREDNLLLLVLLCLALGFGFGLGF